MNLFAPILYLCVQLAVVIFTVLVVATVEQRWGLHTVYSQGDIDAGVACLVAGALLFPLATVLLARSTHSAATWVRQHFWQSGGVYVLLVLSAMYLIQNYQAQRYGLGYGLISGVFVSAAYAVAVNALTLRYLSRPRASSANTSTPDSSRSLR